MVIEEEVAGIEAGMTPDYSQWGEQEIIASLLAKLPSLNRWCVDVGAGDGIKLSNTRALVDQGYSAILIEGNPAKYESLKKNAPPNATVVCHPVSTDEYSLDAILFSTAACPPNPDVLSIDIDGYDYHIWKSLEHYHPKIVMIEFNPTMDVELEFIQPLEGSTGYGSSLRSLVALGESKKYMLVSVTVTNAIFMRNDLCAAWNHSDHDLNTLWNDRCFLTHLFYDYDGKAHAIGYGRSPWIPANDPLALNLKTETL